MSTIGAGLDAAGQAARASAARTLNTSTGLSASWNDLLANTRHGTGTTFGQVLDKQYRFVVHGTGSQLRVEPASPAARRAVAESPAARQALDGLAQLMAGRPSAPKLDGFTLATSAHGYEVNRAVQSMRGAATLDNYYRGVGRASAHIEGTNAVRAGAWVHIGPGRSAALIRQLRNPAPPTQQTLTENSYALKTMLHELQHVVRPRTASERRYMWLSEGTAEQLARWPGAVERAAAQMGIPVLADFHRIVDAEGKVYQRQVESVRGLLRLAGIDPTDATHYEAAERLLKGRPVSDVPTELARLIRDRHDLKGTGWITRRIEGVTSDNRGAHPERVERLADLVRKYNRSSVTVPERVAY